MCYVSCHLPRTPAEQYGLARYAGAGSPPGGGALPKLDAYGAGAAQLRAQQVCGVKTCLLESVQVSLSLSRRR